VAPECVKALGTLDRGSGGPTPPKIQYGQFQRARQGTKLINVSNAEIEELRALFEEVECVMLNKGHFINEAISMLAEILGRMQDHTHKKRNLLRRLRTWDHDNPGTEASTGPSWN
jgi:hypothetical protein